MVKKAKSYESIDLETRVLSASQGELVSILFEHIILNANRAKSAIHRKNFEQKAFFLTKMNNILFSLKDSLIKEHYEEFAQNMTNIYDYCLSLSLKASAENSPEKCDEIIELIKIIKSGWDEALQMLK
jgi:flagellar protein FliS